MKVELQGKKVRQILAKRNLSQNGLALKLGTSSGYMSQLIRGVRNPSPQMRKKIQEVLKIEVFDDIFKLKG